MTTPSPARPLAYVIAHGTNDAATPKQAVLAKWAVEEADRLGLPLIVLVPDKHRMGMGPVMQTLEKGFRFETVRTWNSKSIPRCVVLCFWATDKSLEPLLDHRSVAALGVVSEFEVDEFASDHVTATLDAAGATRLA